MNIYICSRVLTSTKSIKKKFNQLNYSNRFFHSFLLSSLFQGNGYMYVLVTVHKLRTFMQRIVHTYIPDRYKKPTYIPTDRSIDQFSTWAIPLPFPSFILPHGNKHSHTPINKSSCSTSTYTHGCVTYLPALCSAHGVSAQSILDLSAMQCNALHISKTRSYSNSMRSILLPPIRPALHICPINPSMNQLFSLIYSVQHTECLCRSWLGANFSKLYSPSPRGLPFRINEEKWMWRGFPVRCSAGPRLVGVGGSFSIF